MSRRVIGPTYETGWRKYGTHRFIVKKVKRIPSMRPIKTAEQKETIPRTTKHQYNLACKLGSAPMSRIRHTAI